MEEDLSIQALADRVIRPEEIVRVARKIGDIWKSVASLLDAKLFDIGAMDNIRQKESDPIMQAHRMLSKWTGNQADEATPRKLILALYHNDKRDVAQQVFGDKLVSYVVGPETATPPCPEPIEAVPFKVLATGDSFTKEPVVALAPVKVVDGETYGQTYKLQCLRQKDRQTVKLTGRSFPIFSL